MKSFLHFQSFRSPDDILDSNTHSITENLNQENIDDEDKSKHQSSLAYSMDNIANYLTSENKEELILGFDLIANLITLEDSDYLKTCKIFSLKNLYEKLLEKKSASPSESTTTSVLEGDDALKLNALSNEFKSIIAASSLEDKDKSFLNATKLFINIFETFCKIYRIDNPKLLNILKFDPSYKDPIKNLMIFHIELFKIINTKPLAVHDFRSFINENIESFFNNLEVDHIAFKFIFESNNPEVVQEFFKAFKEKRLKMIQ